MARRRNEYESPRHQPQCRVCKTRFENWVEHVAVRQSKWSLLTVGLVNCLFPKLNLVKLEAAELHTRFAPQKLTPAALW